MMYIPTAGMDRETWRRARQIGIGGSDAAHLILDESVFRHKDPEKLLLSKTTDLAEDKQSLQAEMGHYCEPKVAELFARETGRRVHNYNRLVISEKYPWMVANIDRKLYGCLDGLECKTIGFLAASMKAEDPETGESKWRNRFTPGDMEASLINKQEWYVQMQHYMAVLGWKMWHLAVLIENREFLWFDVPRDEPLIKQIIDIEGTWWHDVVLPMRKENNFTIAEDITNGIRSDKRKACGNHPL